MEVELGEAGQGGCVADNDYCQLPVVKLRKTFDLVDRVVDDGDLEDTERDELVGLF